MKKHLLIILAVISIVFGSFYYIKITEYLSLSNPIQELYYGETRYKNFLEIVAFSDLIKGKGGYRDESTWIYYPSTFISDGEQLSLFVSKYNSIILQYRKQIISGIYLYMTYSYKKDRLIEQIEITNSMISNVFAKQLILEIESEGRHATLERVYKFYAEGNPTVSISQSKEMLNYLKPYHIDKAWLEKKSHEILYDDFLNIWFAKGSQRYSKDNLGDLKIERAEIFR